jgi:hypothetical protein
MLFSVTPDVGISKMAWAVPLYPRNQVDRAGFVLVDPGSTGEQLEAAYPVLNNWRSSHAYPLLNFHVNLRRKTSTIQDDALFSQRIKRLESIQLKLRRNQTATMQLSQMQDVGGCRAILSSIPNVERLIESYKRSKFHHQLKGHKDYIKCPKPDGYRGHHLIYQYKGLPNQNTAYDKMRIEIQIRTALQHAWATAVEAVGAFTRQALKSSEGSDEWLRFFALMGSAIAFFEKSPPVPGTPTSLADIFAEIRHLAHKLRVQETLGYYKATLDYVGETKAGSSKYFLMHLSRNTGKVFVTGFLANQSQRANIQYTELELKVGKESGDQVVLVSVDSLKALRRAYPNYFLDTKRFSEIVDRALKAKVRVSAAKDTIKALRPRKKPGDTA